MGQRIPDDTQALLVGELPDLTIEGDMLHIRNRYGLHFAMPLFVLRQVRHQVGKLLAEYDARPDPVVPLCELCVRHNLPRHTE